MSEAKKLVICIGANKTGTTSLEAFFLENGYRVGHQPSGEMLIRSYAEQNWQPILDFVRTADFFQDIPFSARKTYESISRAFPHALFVLTKRRSPEVWYASMMRFYARMFSDGISPPSKAQLMAATYRYKGYMWDVNRALYFTPENDPFRKTEMLEWYHIHTSEARNFFHGTDRLLEVNIEDADAAQKIATFAGIHSAIKTLPHLNRSTK